MAKHAQQQRDGRSFTQVTSGRYRYLACRRFILHQTENLDAIFRTATIRSSESSLALVRHPKKKEVFFRERRHGLHPTAAVEVGGDSHRGTAMKRTEEPP